MCGICGILNLTSTQAIDPMGLERMGHVQQHRGPDDAGTYFEPGFGMASQRLAILDLSANGHMPMASLDGRYVIIHNGEVYNFAQLRDELQRQGVVFRSQSDTEVLLNLYIAEGPAMLAKCNGMFAFAIWDALEKTLFIARDRLGVKPLFYAVQDGRLFFASEPKALFAAGVSRAFDETTWPELLCFRYVAGERTPYRQVKRLLPGHFLRVCQGEMRIQRWWSLAQAVRPQSFPLSERQAAEQLTEMFDRSIALRRISDVPVGALLSGGLDSAAMAAAMSLQAGQGVESFTMRFAEAAYDEGDLARQVADRWQLTAHELYLPAERIPAFLEDATWLLDEPVVHGNDLHLLAIARYAKPRVTVLLSGEGSDEIFGGYVRYRPFRYPLALALLSPGLKFMNALPALNGRLHKMTEIFGLASWQQRLLFGSADVFPAELNLPFDGEQALQYRTQLVNEARQVYTEPVRQLMFYEQHTYLQSILDRNDRMTMGASIECREPYLDTPLVEWAANLPTERLFQRWSGKKVLRQAMRSRLPESVLHHKKWGFGVPWRHYLRQEPALMAYVQRLPHAEALQSCPLPPAQVRQAVEGFLAGDDTRLALVRQLLMTAVWYEICIQGRRGVLAHA
jgi:asparagine synthase (glutamine-hydrolysing)